MGSQSQGVEGNRISKYPFMKRACQNLSVPGEGFEPAAGSLAATPTSL